MRDNFSDQHNGEKHYPSYIQNLTSISNFSLRCNKYTHVLVFFANFKKIKTRMFLKTNKNKNTFKNKWYLI